jgi:hypothetical protein
MRTRCREELAKVDTAPESECGAWERSGEDLANARLGGLAWRVRCPDPADQAVPSAGRQGLPEDGGEDEAGSGCPTGGGSTATAHRSDSGFPAVAWSAHRTGPDRRRFLLARPSFFWLGICLCQVVGNRGEDGSGLLKKLTIGKMMLSRPMTRDRSSAFLPIFCQLFNGWCLVAVAAPRRSASGHSSHFPYVLVRPASVKGIFPFAGGSRRLLVLLAAVLTRLIHPFSRSPADPL